MTFGWMNNEDFITFADGNKITNKYIYMGGIFGTISKKSCVADLFYGTDYNSHLGTRRGGMATFCKEKGFVRSIHNLESSYFRTKFEPTLDRFEGATSGIGVISDTDAQPLIMNSHLGKFAICTVAKILNKDELTNEMLEKNMHFAEMSSGSTNPTERVALRIIQGKTFKEGIENVYRHIKGSCTMLLLTDHGIICARDSWGRTPIIIGKKDGAYAASSESTSFPNLDFDTVYNVGPGEIVKLTADGMEQIRKPNKKMQVCSFLWGYYGFPTSTYEGKNVEQARFDNGFNMAKTDPVEVDCCGGIPDSGTGMAMGYAAGKNVPYQRCIAKYTPTWPRSFTPSNQSMRSLVAKMKLIPNKAMLQGKKVLFCDDSIVRGTQLRDNVKVLFDQAGLKECHMRIACPPLVYGCPFINFTSSKSDMELITRRMIQKFEGDPNKNLDKYATTDSPEYKRMGDEIAKELGLTTLKFNTIEQLIEAIGLPKCQVCTHCFDGSSQFSLETFADED